MGFRRGGDRTECGRFGIQIERTKTSDSNGTNLPRGDKWLEELDGFSQCFFWGCGRKTDFFNDMAWPTRDHANEFCSTCFDAAVELMNSHMLFSNRVNRQLHSVF